MNISLSSNIEQVLGFTARIHPQYRFASALALTRTAVSLKQELIKVMPTVFDKPTRWTLNSLFVQRATKDRLQAVVWFKDTGDSAAGEYLKPHVFGGMRTQKRFEKRLQASGIMPQGWVAVPAKGAKIDSYGNMSSQQIVQILSVLRAQQDYQQNTTDRSKQRARVKGKQRDYFVSGPVNAAVAGNGGRLPFGIYQRLKDKIISIMFFAPRARYTPRFDFFGIAERTVMRDLPGQLDRAWEQALKSAR